MQRIDLMNKDLEEMALKVRTQQASFNYTVKLMALKNFP